MRNLMIKALIVLTVFLAVSVSAQAAPADPTLDTSVPSFNYNEECNNEGCFSEEVRELYSSYHQECIVEGCAFEEQRELAGSRHPVVISQMYQHFRRLGFWVLPQHY